MTEYVFDVDQADFAAKVLQASFQVPVVVDLWAEWCGPCKTLGPLLEQEAAAGGGAWLLAKLDVDQNQQIAQQLGAQSIPTVVAFKDSTEVARFVGAIPQAQIREFISGIVPSPLDEATTRADAALDAGDVEGAREVYEAVLAQDPTHQNAGLSLAGLLMDDGDTDAALAVLERLAPTDEVKQLQAYARLVAGSAADLDELASAAGAGSTADRLAYGRALAGAGSHDQASDVLMGVIGERTEPESDEARALLLDLFELLGGDHPMVRDTRRRLANGLY